MSGDNFGLDEARALYRTMRTPELLRLQTAFQLDLRHVREVESIAFVSGRLAVIAEILSERNR